ncbi:hypothetical protein [Actinomadura sp. 7K534]|uniref:hypothetical protein n=1 Tax=Actinomadura sp. 7K534 TaxID=2530366 RepID=UPI001048B714|nr:hypothetical protein [Actinomadura sp. 7K534]TDB98768.1 hypothetical protein E1266_02225 [Actinomadura sp. 7K534]
MTAIAHQSKLMTGLNTRNHRAALNVFLFIVLAHWAEHVVQAVQIWVLGRPAAESRGVAGQWFPWLVTSEALHYGYALVMLAGFVLLRPGFTGRSRTWWNIALYIQVWHHFEHLLLFIQAHAGANLGGRPVPTSLIQFLIPRVELHLFYNGVVFAPMVVAMLLHRRDEPKPRDGAATCDCAGGRGRPSEV